ncbi:hypothetical protein I6E29_04175 [Arcanobacterium haemolyticum]|nr:hypothetical protein [Arcanobacterium haemolyticum]
MRSRLFEIINSERNNQGAGPLRISLELTEDAQAWAMYQSEHGFDGWHYGDWKYEKNNNEDLPGNHHNGGLLENVGMFYIRTGGISGTFRSADEMAQHIYSAFMRDDHALTMMRPDLDTFGIGLYLTKNSLTDAPAVNIVMNAGKSSFWKNDQLINSYVNPNIQNVDFTGVTKILTGPGTLYRSLVPENEATESPSSPSTHSPSTAPVSEVPRPTYTEEPTSPATAPAQPTDSEELENTPKATTSSGSESNSPLASDNDGSSIGVPSLPSSETSTISAGSGVPSQSHSATQTNERLDGTNRVRGSLAFSGSSSIVLCALGVLLLFGGALATQKLRSQD